MNSMSNVELVKSFLRAQNLEQIGDLDGAISLYESVVGQSFDSSGPYDRLIALYADRAEHAEVVRVAELAIANVHTYADKRAWYERMRSEAVRAQGSLPEAVPKSPAGGDPPAPA